MNRKLIEWKDAKASHIVISFTDDKKFFPKIKQDDGCVGVLRLEIFDWDGKHLNSLFCDGDPVTKDKIFNVDHAKQILQFVDKHLNNIEFIISSCDAGICRSSACAAALSYILHKDDKIFFKPPYYPNRLIYRTLLEEYHTNIENYKSIKEVWKNQIVEEIDRDLRE